MTIDQNVTGLPGGCGMEQEVGQTNATCPVPMEDITIKFPNEPNRMENSRIEYSLFSLDGVYNRVLVMDEQPQEDDRAVLLFTDCPTDKNYSGKINWVNTQTFEKTRSWPLFDNVPFQQLKQ